VRLFEKARRNVGRRPPSRDRRSRTDDLAGYGGPEEAVAYRAEGLPALARRHTLDLLAHLLGITLMETEKYLRVRSKRKLSRTASLRAGPALQRLPRVPINRAAGLAAIRHSRNLMCGLR